MTVQYEPYSVLVVATALLLFIIGIITSAKAERFVIKHTHTQNTKTSDFVFFTTLILCTTIITTYAQYTNTTPSVIIYSSVLTAAVILVLAIIIYTLITAASTLNDLYTACKNSPITFNPITHLKHTTNKKKN